MTTFTSSLPDEVLKELKKVALKKNVPKNKIIEESLNMYFEYLERQEYIKDFKRLKDDPEMQEIAEEGMTDYFEQLNRYD